MNSLYEQSIATNLEYRFELIIECENMIIDREARSLPILNYRFETEGIKYCKNCKKFKMFEGFHKNRSKKWGVSSYCQNCSNENSCNSGKYKDKYICIFCDFSTCKKGNITRHHTTQKHIKKLNLLMPFNTDINIMISKLL
jgi:hypothetical protein